MARISDTQRFPLGTRVSKYFNGFVDPFEGTVDEHSDATDFYHISYDDGDSEEMTEDDVEKHLLSLPGPARPPKPAKPQKMLKLSKSSKPVKTRKPAASPVMKRATSDSFISISSPVAVVPSPKGKGRPKVLSLNANAPGLMRSNSFTGSSSSHENVSESLSVSIPANTLEEEEEEEEEEELVDEEDEDTPSEATSEEVNQLIGRPVERAVMKEGCGTDIVQGTVASYFPATRMFRVMYFDGECSDLTYDEVYTSIPADLRPLRTRGKRKRKTEDATNVRNGKSSASSAPSASPKRPKMLDLNSVSSSSSKSKVRTKRSPTGSSPSSGARSPGTPVALENDMAAVDNVEFNIVRKVLYIVVSTGSSAVMQTQLDILSSSKLKDKEALEAFVRKDGLVSLADLLTKWEDQEETETGVLLLLKTLAVLPGVTRDAIIDSNIGRKVRSIEKRGSFQDPSIPALAAWVIKKMKSDVGVQEEPQGPSANGKREGNKENSSRGSSSPRRSTTKRQDASNQPETANSAKGTRPSKKKTAAPANGSDPSMKRSNSASHLQNLLKSRNGRDASTARRERDIFGNLVAPQSKKRLGTANNWRARRSTVVLDQVTKRVTENAQEGDVLQTKKVEEEEWHPSKISFAGEESVCPFDKDVEVSKLLAFRSSGLAKATKRPQVKPRSGPLRSILRVRLPPPPSPPANREDSSLAPPTVQSTSRPAIDPIIVPSERPLSTEASEDGATESPMFSTSKLSKVVSPTEKRKQGFSPPPCIPPSEQPPLDFTEDVEEGAASGGENSIEKTEDVSKTQDKPRPAEKDEIPVAVASPVVSEDSSSEEGEVSSSDAADSTPKPEAATAASCSTEPKDGGAAGMESAQQAATTSA